jgi:hypothetical protein
MQDMAFVIHFAKLSTRAMWRRPDSLPTPETTPWILPVFGSTIAPPVSRNEDFSIFAA